MVCNSTGQCVSGGTSSGWLQYLVSRWNFENGNLETDSVGTNT
jgi:hypothetical protein